MAAWEGEVLQGEEVTMGKTNGYGHAVLDFYGNAESKTINLGQIVKEDEEDESDQEKKGPTPFNINNKVGPGFESELKKPKKGKKKKKKKIEKGGSNMEEDWEFTNELAKKMKGNEDVIAEH
jgi:hypothetical protein